MNDRDIEQQNAAEAARQEKIAKAAARARQLQENPFDPRTEISADARHVAGRIVSHLWTIFVLLPIVFILVYEVLKSS